MSTFNAEAETTSGPGTGTARVKRGMAEMLKGGVIMDVVTPDQAKIAEDAGAVAVMALERVPADIRTEGGVARMSDPDMIDGIIAAVSIPVMAKCRIGHFAEAQVLQAIGVDYIDESEVLTPADEAHHVDKWKFTVPFVCGATNLGEALRRIAEGAAMIRSKGEAGTGNVVEATRHMRDHQVRDRPAAGLPSEELFTAAKELGAPYELVAEVARAGRLPVVLFTAGGIATPADAALMMQLGAEGVFVGSGIFKSGDPAKRAAAIVKATTFHDDPDVVAKVSRGLGEAMVGINLDTLPADQHYADPRLVIPPGQRRQRPPGAAARLVADLRQPLRLRRPAASAGEERHRFQAFQPKLCLEERCRVRGSGDRRARPAGRRARAPARPGGRRRPRRSACAARRSSAASTAWSSRAASRPRCGGCPSPSTCSSRCAS